MLNSQSLLSSIKTNRKIRNVCLHCKGNGTILVPQKSPFYEGVIEYYPQKCPHCQASE